MGLDDAGIKTGLFEAQPHFCEPLFKARIHFIHFTDSDQFIDSNKRSHTWLRVSTQRGQQINGNKQKTDETEEALLPVRVACSQQRLRALRSDGTARSGRLIKFFPSLSPDFSLTLLPVSEPL